MKSTMKKVFENANFACLVSKLVNIGQNILKDVRCIKIKKYFWKFCSIENNASMK